ncbi:MAG: S8 family serine peptidase, partial [Bacteroidales bacterium]
MKMRIPLPIRLLVSIILALSFNVNINCQNPAHFNNKRFRVKFNLSQAEKLKEMPSQVRVTTRQDFVRTGISSVDALNAKHRTRGFRRMFPYAGRFESRHKQHGLHLWYEVEIDERDSSRIHSIISEYNANRDIDIAEAIPEYKLYDNYTPSFIPNDPLFDNQWHYHNTGQTGGTVGADIDLVNAWDIEKGDTGVIVAVIDGGIELSHSDINANLWINYAELNGTTGVDDDGNGYIDDINGYSFVNGSANIVPHYHGTHVAGTVGAVSNNSTGVAGIAGGSGIERGVKLMSCAVFQGSTGGGFPEAFVYAADNGAIIAQNSWGRTYPGYFDQAIKDAIDYFIANAGFDEFGNPIGPMQGGLVLFSAGNDNDTADWYPGYYDKVMAIAATDHNDLKSSFSNYGSWIELSAPGTGVYSTYTGDSYSSMNGTSMACPHASGVAALIISHFGRTGLTPEFVWDRLVNYTDDLDTINPAYAGKLGTGRLNAFNSLFEADSIPPYAITDLTVDEIGMTTVKLKWTATGESADSGRANYYDIRYYGLLIDSANFNSATRVFPSPAPSMAGTTDSVNITGLSVDNDYYFAVKAVDLSGNQSPISNVVFARTLQAPVINVEPPDLLQSLDSGQVATNNITITNTGLADLIFTITDTSSAVINWLSISPESGIIVPGGNLGIDFTFNSDDLTPKDYTKYILINSNDPVTPVFVLPVTLHVNGIPQISVSEDTLQFPETYINDTSMMIMYVGNTGTDSLIVTSVSSDNSSFNATTDSFFILPDDSLKLDIEFTPISLGSFSGNLSIESNDTATGTVVVVMNGESVLAPVISVTPDSVPVQLMSGDTLVEYLTIDNTAGGSELYVHIDIQRIGQNINRVEKSDNNSIYSNSTVENSTILDKTNNIEDSKVLIIQETTAWYLNMGEYVTDSFGIIPDIYYSSQIDTADFSRYDLIITVGDESSTYYNNISNNSSRFENFVQNGGIIQYQLATQGANVLIPANVNVVYGNMENENRILDSIHPIADGLPPTIFGNYANHCYLVNLPANAKIIIETNISHVPTTAEYEIGNGKIIVTGMTWGWLYNYSNEGKQILYNATKYSLSEANINWISLDDSDYVVPEGTSLNVPVNFDARGMYDGTYDADIVITSNDPLNRKIVVPAHMEVTGIPEIQIETDTIEFSETYVNQSVTDSLLISNIGTKTISIDSIYTDNSIFVVDTGKLTIPPGEEYFVNIDYIPTVVGEDTASLLIESDDTSSPLTEVILIGSSVLPPVILVTPDSIPVGLMSGDTLVEYLTVDNSAGGSDLYIEVSVENPSVNINRMDTANIINRIKNLGAYNVRLENNRIHYEFDGMRTTEQGDERFHIYGNTLLANDLSNIHVMFTSTNRPDFQIELEAREAITSVFTGTLTTSILDTINVLIIGDGDIGSGEIPVVNNWIKDGGGLIIDADQDTSIYNQIITGSGIVYNGLSGNSGITTDITQHPVTDSITQYQVLSSSLSGLDISGDAVSLIRDNSGNTHIAAGNIEQGHVVAIGNEDLWELYYAGHLKLGLNAVYWLTGGTWIDISPQTDTVPAGASSQLELVFDARGLLDGTYDAD